MDPAGSVLGHCESGGHAASQASHLHICSGEMRNASSEWNLAADSGLLLFLRDFGSKLIQRTKDLERHVETLVADTARTDVALHNTVNQARARALAARCRLTLHF